MIAEQKDRIANFERHIPLHVDNIAVTLEDCIDNGQGDLHILKQ